MKEFLRKERVHDFLCRLFYYYIKFVGATSTIVLKGYNKEYLEYVKEGKGTLLCTWHSMIMMAPYGILLITEEAKNRKLGVLASRHKDGRFISKAMRMFGFTEVLGSTTNKKEYITKDNGGAAAIKAMVRGLKSGMSFCMAPDGPRGPAKKINGEILNIIKMAGCPLFPATISYKNKIVIETFSNYFQKKFQNISQLINYVKKEGKNPPKKAQHEGK